MRAGADKARSARGKSGDCRHRTPKPWNRGYGVRRCNRRFGYPRSGGAGQPAFRSAVIGAVQDMTGSKGKRFECTRPCKSTGERTASSVSVLVHVLLHTNLPLGYVRCKPHRSHGLRRLSEPRYHVQSARTPLPPEGNRWLNLPQMSLGERHEGSSHVIPRSAANSANLSRPAPGPPSSPLCLRASVVDPIPRTARPAHMPSACRRGLQRGERHGDPSASFHEDDIACMHGGGACPRTLESPLGHVLRNLHRRQGQDLRFQG